MRQSYAVAAIVLPISLVLGLSNCRPKEQFRAAEQQENPAPKTQDSATNLVDAGPSGKGSPTDFPLGYCEMFPSDPSCWGFPSPTPTPDPTPTPVPQVPRRITISGKVTDKTTAGPLLIAKVSASFNGAGGTAMVDANGLYQIKIDGYGDEGPASLGVCSFATRYGTKCHSFTAKDGVKNDVTMNNVNFELEHSIPKGACKISDQVFATALEGGGCLHAPTQTIWNKAEKEFFKQEDAIDHCHSLKEFGYNDWRLADKGTMLAISGSKNAASHFNFVTTNRPFWTTTVAGKKKTAVLVDLGNSSIREVKVKKKYSVVCYRKP